MTVLLTVQLFIWLTLFSSLVYLLLLLLMWMWFILWHDSCAVNIAVSRCINVNECKCSLLNLHLKSFPNQSKCIFYVWTPTLYSSIANYTNSRWSTHFQSRFCFEKFFLIFFAIFKFMFCFFVIYYFSLILYKKTYTQKNITWKNEQKPRACCGAPAHNIFFQRVFVC